jgi:NAD(P)-dependent dehydrogenase (short-subunit alcohol dehydrogenase family)
MVAKQLIENLCIRAKLELHNLVSSLGLSREPANSVATFGNKFDSEKDSGVSDHGSSEIGGFSHDTALVTGAARGIGAAIARALAREGARLFLTDIAAADGSALAQMLTNSGSHVAFLAADLRDPASCDKIIDAAIERFGPASIMVHAASPDFSGSALELSDSTWDAMLAVNLQAGYRIARRLGKIMSGDGIKGRMLFITSLHAETPRGNPAYGAAKAGMTIMMKEFAKTLGPHGIRVNAIAPGLVAPNWYANAESIVHATPLRRIGKPEEIASMAIALLSDRFSSFVTGTTVTVDGGLSLNNWLDK